MIFEAAGLNSAILDEASNEPFGVYHSAGSCAEDDACAFGVLSYNCLYPGCLERLPRGPYGEVIGAGAAG